MYSDRETIAFRDLNPQAPVHVLLIPREHIGSLAEATEQHQASLARLLQAAPEVARTLGLESGYRVVINTGRDGGQTVAHLHLHLLGGRAMHWPPG